jgi:hypothetical protein
MDQVQNSGDVVSDLRTSPKERNKNQYIEVDLESGIACFGCWLAKVLVFAAYGLILVSIGPNVAGEYTWWWDYSALISLSLSKLIHMTVFNPFGRFNPEKYFVQPEKSSQLYSWLLAMFWVPSALVFLSKMNDDTVIGMALEVGTRILHLIGLLSYVSGSAYPWSKCAHQPFHPFAYPARKSKFSIAPNIKVKQHAS